MKSLKGHLQEESVNESLILAGLATWALIEYACFPLISGAFSKLKQKHDENTSKKEEDKAKDDKKADDKSKDDKSGGENKEGENKGLFGGFFSNFFTKKDEETGEVKGNTENFNKVMLIAKKANEKETDENQKKKNDSMMKLLTACSFDKDGNEIPLEDRLERMKEVAPEGTDIEAWKKDMEANYNKIKDDPEFKKNLEEASKSVKSSDLDKYMEDAKKEAKKTLEEIEAKQKELDEQKKELERIEQESKDAAGEKAKQLAQEKEAVEKKITDIQKTGPLSGVTNTTGGGEPKPANGGGEPKPANGGGEPKPANGGGEPKPANGGGEPKPKDEEQDVDDSDIEGGLSDEDNKEIEKVAAKGAPKPEPPREVMKRPLERGEGFCYYYKDDPDKQSLGEAGKDAIKAQVKYKKALAAWKKNNAEPKNESLSGYLKIIFG